MSRYNQLFWLFFYFFLFFPIFPPCRRPDLGAESRSPGDEKNPLKPTRKGSRPLARPRQRSPDDFAAKIFDFDPFPGMRGFRVDIVDILTCIS